MLKPTVDDIQFVVENFDKNFQATPSGEVRNRIVHLVNTGFIHQKWIYGREVFVAYGPFASAIVAKRLSEICENHMMVCS